jgi:undecaprenyl-diphosphatase
MLAGRSFPLVLAIVLWVLAGSLFVALAVPGWRDAVQAVDDEVLQLAIDTEQAALVASAKVMDVVGGTWGTTTVILGVALMLALRRRWEALITWAIAMGLSQVMIGPVKALYGRARPPGELPLPADIALVHTSGYSFPSGHSVAGAAIAVALVIVLVPAGPKRRLLEFAAAAFAVLMGLSRVYLRAHWLSDVVAGVALGAAASIVAAIVVHQIDERRAARQGESSGP